jgi:hypothetical protein
LIIGAKLCDLLASVLLKLTHGFSTALLSAGRTTNGLHGTLVPAVELAGRSD